METSRTNQRTTKETPLNSANHGLKVWRLLKEQVTEIQVLRFVRLNAQLTLSNMELYADWQGPSTFFGIRDFKSKRWVRVITARDWKYARATSSPGRFFLALEFDAREARCRRCRKQPSGYTVTLDVSMKARPKGCIEIKFYKVVEVHLTTTLLRFVIIVPIIGKPGRFIYFRRIYSCRRLVSPLSSFHRRFIYYNCARNILWG